MDDKNLLAKRINNGQSEVWLEIQPQRKRVVATNGILYPIRTTCSKDESEAFLMALNEGVATVPAMVVDRLAGDFGLV